MSWLCALIALQGVVGTVQYDAHLPTELVWVHVVAASLCWLCVLWQSRRSGTRAARSAQTAQIRASIVQRNS